MDTINTVQINKKTRVAAYYETDAIKPDEFNDVVSVHAIRSNNRYYGPTPGNDTSASVLDEIYQYNDNYAAAIEKHFKRLGTVCKVVDINSGRDWVGEYVFYVEPTMIKDIGNPEEYLKVCIDEYKQFAEGDVYTVTLEKLQVWKNSRGEKREEWEIVDSIGNIYADVYDEKTLLELGLDYFGVKPSKRRTA